jgi:hypothetical protein
MPGVYIATLFFFNVFRHPIAIFLTWQSAGVGGPDFFLHHHLYNFLHHSLKVFFHCTPLPNEEKRWPGFFAL